MKKYIIGMSVMLALGACSNEELVGGSDIQGPAEDKEVSNIASQMVGDYDMLDEEDIDTGTKKATRAGIDNDLNATWTVGDELSITNGTLMYSYNVDAVTNEGKSCTFTVVDGKAAHTSTSPDDAFYAIYPRRAVTEANGAGSWKGAVVKGQIFAQQSYAENMGKAANDNNFGGYYITTEKAKINNTDDATNLSFSFTPLASIVDVNLSSVVLESGDQIAAVYLRDLSNKTIAANFSYDCSSKKLMTTDDGGCAYNYSSRSNVVEVNFFESEADNGKVTYSTIGSDKVVRFYILPVQLSAGVEITIRTLNGHYYTKKASASVGSTTDCPFNSDDTNLATIVKPFYKKYNFGSLSTARKGAWMGCIPNNIFYTMLSIPGSHDAATSSAGSAGKCQNWTIQEQLENGVRAFDMRPCADYSSSQYRLEIKHGSVATGVYFKDACNQIADYLAANPTESAFVFIHMEQPSTGSVSDNDAAGWSYEIYNYVNGLVDGGKALATMNAETKFTDCRGKIVFVYRDDLKTGTADRAGRTLASATYNALKINWNDNIMRTVWGVGTNIKITYQDIYNTANSSEASGDIGGYITPQKGGVKSANAKATLVCNMIDDASSKLDKDRMVINFASYAGSLTSNPGGNASSIMPTVNAKIVATHERLGIIFSDFVDTKYGDYYFPAVTLGNNFKHCFTKRSRVDVMKTYSKTSTGVDVSSDEYADNTGVYARPM